MRKVILLLMAFCCLHIESYANEIKTISVSFKLDDFKLSLNEVGTLEIATNRYNISYSPDSLEPGLPLVPIDVYIPDGYVCQDVQFTQSATLCRENIIVATAPIITPTNTVLPRKL